MTKKKKHVAVLMGGWSAERDVSLVSGRGVADVLEQRGYRVTRVDVQRDLPALLQVLTPRPDVILNALHGRGGEDGTIQGVLEFLGIPYTHSGVMASAIAMNKEITRQLVAQVGVRVPKGVLASRQDILMGSTGIPAPFVIKPVNEGSSVGVRIVRSYDNGAFAHEPWTYGDHALVEEFIDGHELTVAVLGDKALTVTEIKPASDFFDYTSKYTTGHAVHHTPAQVPADIADEAKRFALLAHRVVGCTGVSRSDFRWNPRQGKSGVYFLEINTQPGMTPLSLVPEQAQHLGMSYGDLVEWMVDRARCHA